VDDADAYYREWRGKVTLLRAPNDEAWGARTFGLLDPSVNTIVVMGPLSRTDREQYRKTGISAEKWIGVTNLLYPPLRSCQPQIH